MAILYRCGAALTGLIVCLGASAADPSANPLPRDAYRTIDEKGRVIYSELPPGGTSSKKIDITPANGGSSSAPRTRSDGARRSASTLRDQPAESQQAPDAREQARQKALAELRQKNKCEVYGGDDCADTLTRNPDPTQPLWRTAPPPPPPRLPGVTY